MMGNIKFISVASFTDEAEATAAMREILTPPSCCKIRDVRETKIPIKRPQVASTYSVMKDVLELFGVLPSECLLTLSSLHSKHLISYPRTWCNTFEDQDRIG